MLKVHLSLRTDPFLQQFYQNRNYSPQFNLLKSKSTKIIIQISFPQPKMKDALVYIIKYQAILM